MKTKLILSMLLLGCLAGHAQQDAQFTQYMYNTININPAYAGSRGVMSIFGLYRTQWVGLDGAPKTATFSVNTPLNDSNLGLGASLVSDKIGPTDETAISVDLSYTIPTSRDFKLSFGIKGTADLFSYDASKVNVEDQTDASLQSFSNKFRPNIGAGVYYHSDKAYIGLSVPNFIENDHYNDNDNAIYKEKINYYLMGGYVFDLSSTLKFKPAFLTKLVEGAPLQVDLSANFMFNDKLVLGAAYRWDAAMSFLAGFQINQGLYVGYGYDHETTNLNKYSSGSHEIFLRFDLFRNNGSITTPRFF